MKVVILINFGGPRNREEILPFLTDIFSDVLPWPLKFLAPLLARLRKPYAEKMYSSIGGASPVVGWTVKQAAELEGKLGGGFRVYAGMKYGRPSIEDAKIDAKEDGCEKIILLPLFPYQSRYTSVSLRTKRSNPVNTGDCFVTYAPRNDMRIHTHTLYVSAMVNIIKTALTNWKDVSPPHINLIFSVHAIPLSAIKAGDPYLRQINESVSRIMENFTGFNYHIAFQSASFKFGWTGPDVKTVINQLTHLRTYALTHCLIIPLGFACENIETLYEIDHIYIPYASGLGIQNIARAPALNDNPQFIDLLTSLVLNSGQ